MPMTTFMKNLLLDGGPDTVYVGLYSGGAPGAGGAEIPSADLWGAAAPRPSVDLAAAADGERNPDADTAVGTIAAPANVTHVGWFDAASGGNLLGFAAHARSYAATDTVNVPAANAVFGITD